MESLRSIIYNGPFDTEAHDRPFDKRLTTGRSTKRLTTIRNPYIENPNLHSTCNDNHSEIKR